MHQLQPKTIAGISLLIAGFITLVSITGIYAPDFYSREAANWQIQSGTQDIVDLVLIVPVLVVLSLLTFSNKRAASLLWGGVMLYLTYTFVIYCFDVHFNILFPFYCIILGLCVFTFTWFLYTQIREPSAAIPATGIVLGVTGVYFVAVSILFYILWLGEIIPSLLENSIPKSLVEAGLPTNPVHVLDLSVVLPGIFMTGVLVLKKRPLGVTLIPVVLVFFILMDITIASLALSMNKNGLGGGLSVAVIMGALATFSLILLIWYLLYLRDNEKS